MGVLDDDKIEPAAATFAAGGYTDFAANFLELLAYFVELFRGEGTARMCQLVCIVISISNSLRSYTRGVCLHHTDDLLERPPSQAQTSEYTTKSSVRGCDKWVCSVVDIQHESIGTLDQNFRFLFLGGCE